MAVLAGWGVDPQPVLVPRSAQHLSDSVGGQRARLVPSAVLHGPQVIAGALRGAAIGERHPIDLLHSLREDRRNQRPLAGHRSQLFTHSELAHALPAADGLDLRVQWLGLAHTRATSDE